MLREGLSACVTTAQPHWRRGAWPWLEVGSGLCSRERPSSARLVSPTANEEPPSGTMRPSLMGRKAENPGVGLTRLEKDPPECRLPARRALEAPGPPLDPTSVNSLTPMGCCPLQQPPASRSEVKVDRTGLGPPRSEGDGQRRVPSQREGPPLLLHRACPGKKPSYSRPG